MRAGIFYIIFDFIAEFGKRIENRYKRPTIVMVNQVTNIFKENHFRFYCISNTCNFKEQITSWVFKTTLISHKGKTLWGTRKAYLNFRNSFCTDLKYQAQTMSVSKQSCLGDAGKHQYHSPPNYSSSARRSIPPIPENNTNVVYPLFLTAFSTISAHSVKFFFISLPQNRKTVQPSNSSFAVTSRSRSIFLSIFEIQNS